MYEEEERPQSEKISMAEGIRFHDDVREESSTVPGRERQRGTANGTTVWPRDLREEEGKENSRGC